MDRAQHLEFCTKCVHQKLDPRQGIVCKLTNNIADFDLECASFEMDGSLIDQIQSKEDLKFESNNATGFSPKKSGRIAFSELNKQEALVLAYRSAKSLGWNISNVNASGFVAYTTFSILSWGEEIQVNVKVGEIQIKSECTGNQIIDWGKNKKNIGLFFKLFSGNIPLMKGSDITEAYAQLADNFVEIDTNDSQQNILATKEKVKGFFSLLNPTQGYFVTPIIILLNLLVFGVMAVEGVDVFNPSIEMLITWGANFRPTTMGGEFWRVLSCNYIHIGLFHLLFNMYALMYIGLLLEPLIGRVRLLLAYLLTGIFSSIISLYWNDLLVSAGASGAIFGLYGVFIAMLSTKLINKSARKSLLISMAVFVGYNLLNGLKGGIDNAAHIGGLISGIIVGFCLYPSIITPTIKKQVVGIMSSILIIFAASYFLLSGNILSIVKYEQALQEFSVYEDKALGLYKISAYSTGPELLTEIEVNGIPNWEKCHAILEEIDQTELPKVEVEKIEILKNYCELRIKRYKLLYKSMKSNSNIYDLEIDILNEDIKDILASLGA